MATLFHLRRTQFLLALASIAATIQVGCGEREQIRSYSIPKETKTAVAEAAPALKPGEPTDRMLAAILPAGGQAWFFKVVGPIPEIDKREKEFNDFFAAIRFADDGKPKWQLPAGWKEAAGNAMRFATIVVPSEGKPLEITVNSLPWSGTPDDMLSNVNRWRGQLQLPPIGAGQVAEGTREAKAGDRPMTIVDLRGRFAGSGMSPPFAGRPAGAAPGAAPGAPPSDLPPGHPPIGAGQAVPPSGPIANSTAADVPNFKAPANWRPLSADEFRKAAFEIDEGDRKARVTVTRFARDAGPKIGDPLENINQWRRAIGLETIKQDALAGSIESIEVDGHAATLARIMPDAAKLEESKIGDATFAAMVPVGEQIWFIKLTGDGSLVRAQEDAFKTFLKSLRFAAGSGATDGDK